MKVATTKAQRKLFFNLRSMKRGLGPLTQEELQNIADTLNVKPEEVVEMETRLAGQDVALEPGWTTTRISYAPIAYLADPTRRAARLIERAQTERLRSAGLDSALGTLDARSRRIIEARWLHEQDPATLHDLADEFGVSAERIRQIEAKALQKMRGFIGAAAG